MFRKLAIALGATAVIAAAALAPTAASAKGGNTGAITGWRPWRRLYVGLYPGYVGRRLLHRCARWCGPSTASACATSRSATDRIDPVTLTSPGFAPPRGRGFVLDLGVQGLNGRPCASAAAMCLYACARQPLLA